MTAISRSQVSLAAALLLLMPLAGSADQWADQVFPVKKHDFGTVAVASKTEFRFPIKNVTDQQIHISGVRASCGCTTPIVETQSIAPGETGSILARFNTRTFKGQRGATLTVTLDRPRYHEVRLRVDGYIRSDMVFHPGAIEFGTVSQGDAVTKTSELMYAGRNDWKLVEISSNQPWLMPSFEQSLRGGGRVNYRISVDLREDAPTGYFQDELVLITNDRSMPRVPLRVSGSVESLLTISPQAISLGRVKPGESVSEKLIVRGQKPFVIESLKCDGWEIECETGQEPKSTHILFARFTPAAESVGPQKATIEISTAGEQSVTAKALLTAEVRDQ